MTTAPPQFTLSTGAFTHKNTVFIQFLAVKFSLLWTQWHEGLYSVYLTGLNIFLCRCKPSFLKTGLLIWPPTAKKKRSQDPTFTLKKTSRHVIVISVIVTKLENRFTKAQQRKNYRHHQLTLWYNYTKSFISATPWRQLQFNNFNLENPDIYSDQWKIT